MIHSTQPPTDVTSAFVFTSRIQDAVNDGKCTVLDINTTSSGVKLSVSDISKIAHAPQIRELWMSGHELKEVPDLSTLKHLQVIDISKNDLSAAPSWLEVAAGSLRRVSLRLNQLRSWPVVLNPIPLHELDLAFNQIDRIRLSARGTGAAGRLKSQIHRVMSRAPILTRTLRVLDLSFNHLSGFPSRLLRAFDQLHTLDLSANDIPVLPPSLGPRLESSLERLRLNDVGLTAFPPAVLAALELRELSLDHHPHLTSIPQEIQMLQRLEELHMDHCGLDDIYPLHYLSQLRRLHLAANRIRTLPAELSHLVRLQVLDLSHNRIDAVPIWIDRLSSLQHLSLAHNQVSAVSESLGRLTALRHLDLGHNNIVSLPRTVAALAALEYLAVPANLLFAPPPVSGMTALRHLDLAHNKLTAVPTGIGSCTFLSVLRLPYNQINTLPDDLYRLHRLSELILRHNRISRIDPAITRLAALKHLDLANNELSSLPGRAIRGVRWPCLETLEVSFNSESILYDEDELNDNNNSNNSNNNNNNNNNNSTNNKDQDHPPPSSSSSSSSSLTSPWQDWARKSGVVLKSHHEVPDRVASGLYIGSADMASSCRTLHRLGITHVLTIATDIPPPHPTDFTYRIIAVEDSRAANLLRHFPDAIAFIEEGRRCGGVMVHCQAGASRSATVVTAYLMQSRGWTAHKAFRYLCHCRPAVTPNQSFRQQLHRYEQQLQQQQQQEEEQQQNLNQNINDMDNNTHNNNSPPSQASPEHPSSPLSLTSTSTSSKPSKKEWDGTRTPSGALDNHAREHDQREHPNQEKDPHHAPVSSAPSSSSSPSHAEGSSPPSLADRKPAGLRINTTTNRTRTTDHPGHHPSHHHHHNNNNNNNNNTKHCSSTEAGNADEDKSPLSAEDGKGEVDFDVPPPPSPVLTKASRRTQVSHVRIPENEDKPAEEPQS